MYFLKRQILFYFKILCVGFLGKSVTWGSPSIDQSINSGGGWVNSTQNSSFNVYGELYLSTTAQPGQFNSIPTDLNSTFFLSVVENQPVGTAVGEFSATDPDDGGTLTYNLVSGVGDTNNNLFTLESNGTLKTAVTFDYESNASTYAIRVEAKDGQRYGGRLHGRLDQYQRTAFDQFRWSGATASLSVAENRAVTTGAGLIRTGTI